VAQVNAIGRSDSNTTIPATIRAGKM
jgi:hypothetical protein